MYMHIKKVRRIGLIISLCFLLCSCYDGDLYKGRRPIDYPNSYWVCEEHDMYFVIGENQELIDAKITAYGQTVPFKFIWSSISNEVSINFVVDSQLYGMRGYCKFGRKKFTIQIEYVDNPEITPQIIEYKENPEEAPLMEFERRTLEEYLADYEKMVETEGNTEQNNTTHNTGDGSMC